jgi:hypothetical protein
MTDALHSWRNADSPLVFSTSSWQQGWIAEQVDDHWEVYYTPTERMRIGADGSLSFGGQPEYIFQTKEWAQLCADRLNSLDTAFGRGPCSMMLSSSGNLGIGTTSSSFALEVRNGRSLNAESLLAIDQQGVVKHFNLPALFMIWWRSTTLHRLWSKLMWGERGYDD